MREPRARPSKVWWKDMAKRRTRKVRPVATDRAIPMKMEWKRMPASRRRHWRRRFCWVWGWEGGEVVVGEGEGFSRSREVRSEKFSELSSSSSAFGGL